MLEKGTFDARKYQKEYKELLVRNNLPYSQTGTYNAENIFNSYNDEGFYFLKALGKTITIQKPALENGGDKTLMDIFKTTSKDNVDIRTALSKKFKNILFFSKQQEAELLELKKLYDTIDSDKHAKRFIQKYLNKQSTLNSIKSLNDILDNVPAKKLDIFSDNAFKIINGTTQEERIPALLKEIENPFFETDEVRIHRKLQEKYGYQTKPSDFSILTTRVKNYFNILKDRMTK